MDRDTQRTKSPDPMKEKGTAGAMRTTTAAKIMKTVSSFSLFQ